MYIKFLTTASTHFVLSCFVVFPTFFECYLKYMKWLPSWQTSHMSNFFFFFSQNSHRSILSIFFYIHLNKPHSPWWWDKHLQRLTHAETDTRPQRPNPIPFQCLYSFNNKYLIICCHMPPYPLTPKNLFISYLNKL